MLSRGFIAVAVSGLALAGAAAVCAQEYPVKPIRFITSPVGGGNDFAARVISQGLSGGSLGQQVIVDNRPGGVIPGGIVSKSAPDGYTLLVAGGTFVLGPLLQETPYDVVKDFATIALTGVAPNIVTLHPSLPVKSVKDLIALARARPGELNYGTAGTGSTNHLSVELFQAMAGVKVTRVAYKGTGPSITSLVAGETQFVFANSQSVGTQVKAGRLRAIAVTSSKPSALFPDLPTVAASGLPGYEAISIDGIWAPAKTPGAVINRLNQEISRVLGRADIRQRFLDAGVESAVSSPEELAAMVKSEMAKWGKVVRDAGIRL